MAEMKAAVLVEYDKPLEFMDRPVPEVTRADQVRVRVEGAGVCATDVHAIAGQMEVAGVSLPRVLGHENAGRVEEVGDLVSTVKPGDAVLLYPPHSCGLCVNCRRGSDMHCDHHEFTGLSVDGGFSEYVVVTERSLVPLPAGIDPIDVAPHADAGITAYHAVERLSELMLPGTTAVAIGVGGVGHIGLQLIRELGSSRVIAVDPFPARRELAEELGADASVDSRDVVDAVRDLTGGLGADVVFDFVGTQETHDASFGALARRGTLALVGYGGMISMPSAALVGQEQAIVGNLVGNWTDLRDLLELHCAGRVTLRSERYPFDQLNEILDSLRDGAITGRAVVTPSANGAG